LNATSTTTRSGPTREVTTNAPSGSLRHARIAEWVKQDLSVVEIADLPARRGVPAPYAHALARTSRRPGAGGHGTRRVEAGPTRPDLGERVDGYSLSP
jgi:hypothetical protein